MSSHLFVGVDGGATKAVVRLEDAAGNLLGRVIGQPANIRLSVDKAWQAINEALNELLQSLDMSLHDPKYQLHVGMGLAGCEIAKAYEAFLRHTHSFHTLVLSSDAHVACLGAHQGADGAIIIAGTGVVGYQQCQGMTSKVSGWGFPHDDAGSGAWMGLQAVQLTLQALDGRRKSSLLSERIFAHFDHQRDAFVSWLARADSTLFATLAPIVINASLEGDIEALTIMRAAASALDAVSAALIREQSADNILPCVLLGGVAPFIEPHLNEALRSRLVAAQSPPDAGAIWLVREYLVKARGLV
jgi:glucosamine kinase